LEVSLIFKMRTIYNYAKYLATGKLNQIDFIQMRNDYMVNKNRDIEICSWINSFIRPKLNIKKSTGLIGNLNELDVKKIVSSIDENGYYVFEKTASDKTLDSIKQFMETVPVTLRTTEGNGLVECDGYRRNAERSNRFDLQSLEYCNNNEDILKLITDENFLHIANEYLNAKPILDIVTIWWNKQIPESLTVDKRNHLKSVSAQMFHHDMDRMKFIKFFLYVTDVDMKSGPHVFVRKSHRRSPEYILKDGRYSDELIEQHAKKDVVYISGKRGTIIAVDTRGLHKGLEVVEGERLLFQIEFTNSLFGKPDFPDFNLKLQPKAAFKKVYSIYSKK